MKRFYELFCVVILSEIAGSSSGISTNVVSHAFCESDLSENDKMDKKTLDEVHTFAELKHDPRASLPDSFTICSAIMTTNCQTFDWPIYFNLLDDNRTQLVVPNRSYGSMENLFFINQLSINIQGNSTGEKTIPPLFPNEWSRSCMSANTNTGLIQWVVEGTLVLTTVAQEVKESKNKPKDLSKKLVLSAMLYGGVWTAATHKVSSLNIFSSALTEEEMETMTGEEGCIKEGDYLAWQDMEWILHGQARIETVDQEELCGEPYVDLYHTPFPDWDACIHHCENLGTRVPSVTNSEDWAKLQNDLKTNLYDKGLSTKHLWLPITDKETEGEWIDFYTESVLENFSQPWVLF